jgi:hypothetical protein
LSPDLHFALIHPIAALICVNRRCDSVDLNQEHSCPLDDKAIDAGVISHTRQSSSNSHQASSGRSAYCRFTLSVVYEQRPAMSDCIEEAN